MWPDLRSTSALVGLVAGNGIEVQIYCNFHLNPLIRKRKLSPLGFVDSPLNLPEGRL